MIPFKIDPNNAIPWEHESTSQSLLRKAKEQKSFSEIKSLEEIFNQTSSHSLNYNSRDKDYSIFKDGSDDNVFGWETVPPIRIVEAPQDLLHLGEFVIYDGHHRRAAAKKYGIEIPALLISTDEEISHLIAIRQALGTGWGPFSQSSEELPATFKAHRNYVWDRAREHLGLKPKLPSGIQYIKNPIKNNPYSNKIEYILNK